MADTHAGRRGQDRVGPSTDDRISNWGWLAFFLTGVFAIACYQAIPGTISRDVSYLSIGLYGVSGIVLGIRHHRPVLSLPWYLMALGQLCWVTGDGIYSWYEDVLGLDPFPSVADTFYLVGYPLIAAGLLLLIRGRRPHRDVPALVDNAIVTAGLGLLSWVMLARPAIEQSKDSVLSAAVAAAYPVGDILLVGTMVMLMTSPGGSSRALRLLLVALGLVVVGDSLYLRLSLFGAGASDAIDTLWLASYVLWGTAALHPSIVKLSRPTSAVDVQFRPARLVAMTMAALVAPGALAAQWLTGSRMDIGAVIIASVLLVVLVVSRMKLGIDQLAAANAELERLQHELAFQAAHDPLTELPNRPEALRAMHAALSRRHRSDELVALLFIDLDGFKAVNDTHGHRAGDDVLRNVAGRLRANVRTGDTPARLGGDEFVVLLEPVESEAVAVAAAERLIEAISRPIRLGAGVEASVGASIGIAFNQDRSIESDTLLHQADVAAYRAKAGGRGRAEVFHSAMGEKPDDESALEEAIRGAIERDELVLHYQPILNLKTREVDSYEALVRWERPGVGLLPPSEFIPTAETSNLICELDTWVLHEAARQIAAWNRAGTPGRVVAVNISGRHVNYPRIIDDATGAAAAHGIDPSQLTLEITETVLVDPRLAVDNLEELRRRGFRVALDDFGTGYMSYDQLSGLPVDKVKIDRSYLDNNVESSSHILRILVQSAHAFGLPVVAEGVERAEQLELLEFLGVQAAQGYLLGAPMTLAELEEDHDWRGAEVELISTE